MVAFNKFNLFSQDLSRGSHHFQSGGDAFLAMLTNTAPVATNHLYGDISGTELASGGGYTTGGATLTESDSSTSGVETVSMTAGSPTWTGSGGGTASFRYLAVYNNTTSSPLKPLVAWFDYGSSILLNSGDTFTVSWPSGFFTVT
jgi:hypothetical protein